jgi:MFS family permease
VAPEEANMQAAGESRAPVKWHHGLTGYHYLVLVVASLGWAFDTMDQWIFNLVKGPALNDLVTSPADPRPEYLIGVALSVFLVGWATGGFFFGMVGDRLGRTRTMVFTILIYAAFTFASGWAQTWQQFIAFRFLTGLGIGGEFAAGAALIAETFPEHARATGLGLMQAASALGNMTAVVLNMMVGANPRYGWRWMFFVGVVPALLTLVIRLFVREPEKWQAARKAADSGEKRVGSIPELFRVATLRRNTLVGVALAAVGVIGFWGIGVWSPELARNAYSPGGVAEMKSWAERMVSTAVLLQQAGAFFGMLAWAWLAQRVGRRRAFGITFLVCAAVVPATFHITASGAATGAILVMYSLLGFCTTSLFGGYAVYFPELYPTRLRATGVGFCYNVARYLAIAGPYTLGVLKAQVGIAWAATIVSSVFLLGLLALPWAPETRGKPLPED